MPTRKLPLSSNPEWTALPSDPNTPFTPEQDAAFYSPGAARMLRDLVLAAAHDASAAPVHQLTPQATTLLEKARANVP